MIVVGVLRQLDMGSRISLKFKGMLIASRRLIDVVRTSNELIRI